MTMTTIICAAVLLFAGAALAVYTLAHPPPRDDPEARRRKIHAAYGRTAVAGVLSGGGLFLVGLWPLALGIVFGSALNGLGWLGTHPALHARVRPPDGDG